VTLPRQALGEHPHEAVRTYRLLPKGIAEQYTMGACRGGGRGVQHAEQAALRRSELVALQTNHVELTSEGLRLLIGHSKTDQAGEGATIAIPEGRRIRPKALLLEWTNAALEAAHRLNDPRISFEEGPLFRRLTRSGGLTANPMSDRAVARLVQRCAAAAGFNPTDYAGHSLRSGFLTEAARQGASIFKMRDVSRHKSVQVLSDYVRDFEMFRDHAGEKFL